MPALSKTRIVFCTYPSLYSGIVLQQLIRAEQEGQALELVGVVCSTRVLKKNAPAFWGSLCQFWRSGPQYGLYLLCITAAYRLIYFFKKQDGFESLLKKYLGQKSSLKVLHTRDINQPVVQHELEQLKPDLLLSAHFNQCIGTEVLALPRLGCLNIHPSLLPDYRGIDPAFYVLLEDKNRTGVTVHWQDTQLDTGALVALQSVPIHPQDSLTSLNKRLFQRGIDLALDCIRSGLSTPEQAWQQAAGEGRYDSWPGWYQAWRFSLKRAYGRWRNF